MLSNVNDILIPVLILVVLLLTIAIVTCVTLFIIPMKKRINELSLTMFTLLRKDSIQTDSIDSIKRAIYTVHENIGSLSTSTNKVINELNTVRNQSIMPTPQLANMIRETINEQITIESLLSHNMKIPNKNSTEYIIENTAKTYPNVNKEYIVKLSMAMIENFTLNEQEKQNQNKK